MTAEEREQRANRLRPVLEAAAIDQSLRSIADQAGLSHATLSKFLGGQTPSRRTLDKVERWLARGVSGDIGSDGFEEAPTPWNEESPASRVVRALDSSQEMRELVAEIGRERVVKAAYAVALEEGWDEDELKKLDHWRERTLGHKSQ